MIATATSKNSQARKTVASVGTFEPTDAMIGRVVDVLKSGRISYGTQCRLFEKKIAIMHGSQFGVLSNSGTSSLQVALQTLKEIHGWQDGDEVLVPALTFVATVNIVLHCNLTPVLVDIESDYYGIDPDQIEDAITDRTRCIIPVHLFGRPCRIDEVVQIARKYDLKIIEDSCESMFVGRTNSGGMHIPVGGWGDIGCFSFYVAHLLTCGIGGMSVTNNSQYASYMRSLVNHGLCLDELPTGEDYDPTFLSRKFTFNRIGHSFRITELEAAIGLAQLETYQDMMRKRAANVEYLHEGMRGIDALKLPTDSTEPHMMFPIVATTGKNGIMYHLNLRGIETRDMVPLTNQPAYARMWQEEDYPTARYINRCGYYVGCHEGLSTEQLDAIIAAHKEYFR
jgi:CDP-6-deoxy-D-xylo-4-hexulose-3-dehydrase/perosamine synthetase